MRIAVIGLGYVGLSMSCLLAAHHEVVAVDILPERVDAVNDGISPIGDPEIETALSGGLPNLRATTSLAQACADADFIVIATPTDYNPNEERFDTSSIDGILYQLDELGASGCVAIKSTVPVGYTKRASATHPELAILFSPEFLREGHALYDNLHPSRIIVGIPERNARLEALAESFAALLEEGADEEPGSIPTVIVGSAEAEAVKLFANTFLAMRVAFFNELDTFAEATGLDSAELIEGICLDPRIGGHYNNPSFGYGGNCLPKDSMQLQASYEGVPQDLVGATVSANRTRKDFIASRVEQLARELMQPGETGPVVGVYRLAMKRGSDNFRNSSVLDIMERLRERGIEVLVYEPLLGDGDLPDAIVASGLEDFKQRSTLIIANRYEDELDDVREKVYTRDLFSRD